MIFYAWHQTMLLPVIEVLFQKMNLFQSDWILGGEYYARLLLDIAEWDNVTFQYWDTKNNNWSTALNVAKKAEAWQRTTYPKTLGTTIQGSFIIKQ